MNIDIMYKREKRDLTSIVNMPTANMPFLTLMLFCRFLLAPYAQIYPRVITLAALHMLCKVSTVKAR